MGDQRLMSVWVVWVCLTFGIFFNIRSTEKTPELTPTPVNSVDLHVFPDALVCHTLEESPSKGGPSWMGITIGQSTLADLRKLLSTLSNDYVYIDDDDYDSRFVILELDRREPDLPSSVRLCLVENVIQVLAITYNVGLSAPRLNISDLVAQFGEPDAITWTDNPASRVAFWFERGIAFDITVIPNDPNYSHLQPTFGRVEVEIYFSYQEVEGYEDRWPYNQTRKFNAHLPSPEDPSVDFGPENPFDFDAMIATITAEPSRTPTPTFMPRPTATPIPSTTATATASSRR